ncbi:MAG: hypothetical protein HY873_12940 [Chloroflexi bacterium]|nr:hypothetical protein [Chloroflexota bacterium]
MNIEMQAEVMKMEQRRTAADTERRAQWKRELAILRSQAATRNERRWKPEALRTDAWSRI